MKRTFLLLALVISVMVTIAPALADGDFYVVAVGGGVGTKITSLPYEIKNPGFYYLAGNLTYTGQGNALTINADNVTLDLMGFCLSGNGDYWGINFNYKNNVEVRNGSVMNCLLGIAMTGANNRIINIRSEKNEYGIDVMGYGNLIKGCAISDNNNRGIWLQGAAIISNNVMNNNGNYGIYVVPNLGCYASITGNMVSNATICIWSNGSGSIIGNTVIPDPGQTGIVLSTNANYRIMLDQNTVSGGGTPFSGGSASTIKGTNAGF